MQKELISELLNDLESVFRSEELSTRQKGIKFYKLFYNAISLFLKDDGQFFPNNYSAFIYLLQKYKIERKYAANLHKLRFSLSLIGTNKKINPTESVTAQYYFALDSFFKFLFGLGSDALESMPDIDLSGYEKKRGSSGKYMVIARFGNKLIEDKDDILCKYGDGTDHLVKFRKPWTDILKIVKPGDHLYLHNFSEKGERIIVDHKAIVVYEPDILMDVTDIAECFTQAGHNYLIYFLKKFTATLTNEAIMLGNIINYVFDELITGKEKDSDIIFQNSLKQRPVQSLSLAIRNSNSITILKDRMQGQFEILKQAVDLLPSGRKSVEPSFISPEYGLQGRLDLLIEHPDDPMKKDIIELKSGKPASKNYFVDFGDKKFTTGVWNNNLAQVSCYNLLLDSNFEGRTGSSSILYSGTQDAPRRNVPNINRNKQEIMIVRNMIIAVEKALASGKYAVLSQLDPGLATGFPPFKIEALKEFSNFYEVMNDLERSYFHASITFVLRETLASKVGYGLEYSRNSFADLWNLSIEERAERNSIILTKKLIFNESDLETLHVRYSLQPDQDHSFRVGDLITIREYRDDDHIYKGNLIKGAIRELSDEMITITLRNKSLNLDTILNDSIKIIEADQLDTLNKKVLSFIYEFLNNFKKKNLLLGLKEPGSGKIDKYIPSYLNSIQKKVYSSAVEARDYYLVQGPPGSGKTSYMMRALVEYYLSEGTNIFLIAYTNRAVDEMYHAIRRIDPDINAIRLGNKDSSEEKDIMLSHLVDRYDLNYVYRKVKKCRIFLSTVATIINNREIFDIKDFGVAIIDEASQIQETQLIGIVAKFPKFIMIGDQMQLPPIISQDISKAKISNERLNEIGLDDLSGSLFSRLMRLSHQNKWDHAYGLLTYQARMHYRIQEFPSKMFYYSQLQCLPTMSLDDKLRFYNEEVNGDLSEKLKNNRLLFFNSELEFHSKFNISEAELSVKIVEDILNNSSIKPEEIGVISPFRAQNSQIRQRLSKKLRDSITVDTVERYQGSERKIIIISMAVNRVMDLHNASSTIIENELYIDRKLNVALTRAKEQLIIIGNRQILNAADLYGKLLAHIDEKGSSANVSEFLD